jgi:hypothetical protein
METFSRKHVLPEADMNYYTEVEAMPIRAQNTMAALTEADVENTLNGLRVDSGTGPDLLPARILKWCSAQLVKPVLMLMLIILKTGTWPTAWLEHWVVPLYKKKNVYCPDNYRGIHLTAQLSKVAERLIRSLYRPFITLCNSFGHNQFAYTPGRGARDALAVMVLTWARALAAKRKI